MSYRAAGKPRIARPGAAIPEAERPRSSQRSTCLSVGCRARFRGNAHEHRMPRTDRPRRDVQRTSTGMLPQMVARSPLGSGRRRAPRSPSDPARQHRRPATAGATARGLTGSDREQGRMPWTVRLVRNRKYDAVDRSTGTRTTSTDATRQAVTVAAQVKRAERGTLQRSRTADAGTSSAARPTRRCGRGASPAPAANTRQGHSAGHPASPLLPAHSSQLTPASPLLPIHSCHPFLPPIPASPFLPTHSSPPLPANPPPQSRHGATAGSFQCAAPDDRAAPPTRASPD